MRYLFSGDRRVVLLVLLALVLSTAALEASVANLPVMVVERGFVQIAEG